MPRKFVYKHMYAENMTRASSMAGPLNAFDLIAILSGKSVFDLKSGIRIAIEYILYERRKIDSFRFNVAFKAWRQGTDCTIDVEDRILALVAYAAGIEITVLLPKVTRIVGLRNSKTQAIVAASEKGYYLLNRSQKESKITKFFKKEDELKINVVHNDAVKDVMKSEKKGNNRMMRILKVHIPNTDEHIISDLLSISYSPEMAHYLIEGYKIYSKNEEEYVIHLL